MSDEPLDVAIVGAGQAGLALSYFLRSTPVRFACFDGAPSVGTSWRERYDSLRLFTPAQHDSLPGLPFPAPRDHLPTKDEVAAYLASYAARFELPVQTNHRAQRLDRRDGCFELTTTEGQVRADQVVVATGAYRTPVIPAFAAGLDEAVGQLHSSAYRHPSQLPRGTVLVVGAGASGLQIATELSATHRVVVSQGSAQPVLPERLLGRSIFDWLGDLDLGRPELHRVIERTVNLAPSLRRLLQRGEPLVGQGPRELARRHGFALRHRATRATGRDVGFVRGLDLRVDAVVWATGYRPGYDWIHVPGALDAQGEPVHDAGVSAADGLFFLGLRWMTGWGSSLLGWVGRDAERLAERLVALRAVGGLKP